MEHSFLDRYSHLGSVIHNLDARTKILCFLGLIGLTVLTPPQYWPIFLAHFSLMALVLILSRVPVGYVLTRSLIILPFVLLTAVFLPFLPGDRPAGGTSLGIGTVTLTASGLQVFWNILLKGFIGVFAIILLSATTPFPRILEALRKFKVPAIFTLLLGFIYRYLFVLLDEVLRLKQAIESRGYQGRWIWQAKSLGRMLGQLFLRTYERGERVYLGMMSRGFQGETRTLTPSRLRPGDYLFLILFLSVTALSQFLFR
jgi:cobalt/nickel transport system permease protein